MTDLIQNKDDFLVRYTKDEDTNVNYIIIFQIGARGNGILPIAICPRYNADGTLYTGD